MKHIKLYILLLFSSVIFGSCTKWLDGAIPKDQNIEGEQYSSEIGINSVLNGLYRELVSEDLYGGQMTMTTIELLSHYYYHADDISYNPNLIQFHQIGTYQYNATEPLNRFKKIWEKYYNLLFRVNNFIYNVESSNVLSAEKKNIVLGEAHALRAFLHLDLFRLFGSSTEGIPYNDSHEVVPHQKQPMEAYFTLLLKDIGTAKTLLANDPIITGGIKIVEENENIPESELFYEYYRNYRMNIYAVKALEARTLAHQGKIAEAAIIASEIIANSQGADLPFNWTNPTDVTNEFDYTFYSEIIFGPQNLDIYDRWNKYVAGTRLGSVYLVEQNNLRSNILRFDVIPSSEISNWEDSRIRQWQGSKLTGYYISNKFADYNLKETDPKKYLQPLIRMAEMHYILAENELAQNQTSNAVKIINEVRAKRGVQQASLPNPATVSKADAYSMLEAEYYKEFYAEGQSFFYLKRQNAQSLFNANGSGYVNITDYVTPSTGSIFVIPIPESETNI